MRTGTVTRLRLAAARPLLRPELLDQPELRRTRQERLAILVRQTAVRGLELGVDAAQIVDALKAELGGRGQASPPTPPTRRAPRSRNPAAVDAQSMRGTVSAVRAGEMLDEVTLDAASAQVGAAITRASLDRLQLESLAAQAAAYVKAIVVTLGR